MDRRQKFVPVAKMVLAELSGRITHRLQNRRDCNGFSGYSNCRTGLTYSGHAGADRQLTSDEVRAARRAALLGIVVGEKHTFLGYLVEIRRPACHQAAMVSSNIPHADIVAHNDEDIWLGLLRSSLAVKSHRGEACRQQAQPFCFCLPHSGLSLFLTVTRAEVVR